MVFASSARLASPREDKSMIGLGVAKGFGGTWRLDESPSPKESWAERQRRLWEEALAKLDAALAKQKSKRTKR